jgi:cytochrome P450
MEGATATERASRSAPARLPPGPSTPPALQTLAVLLRPVGFAERCRRRFGDTFRVHFLPAGEVVMVSEPESLKRLFGADRVNTIAPGRNAALEPLVGPRSVLLLTGDEHLRRRKLMLPRFHGERIRAYEATIERATELELAGWPLGRPFALHARMQAITLEVILTAVFGVGEKRREELRRSLVAILAATRSPSTVGITVRRLAWVPRFQRIRRLIERTDDLLRAEIADRRRDRDLDGREDILSMLVAARFEDGSAMDDDELRDQLMTLLVAGHETTATALAWTFELLLRSPVEHERARAAARAGDDAHLDAVATEALRLRPVVPFTGRKLLQPAELGGYALPAGTVVLASIWLAHTREQTFAEPYEFRPERFANGGPETYFWVPFGGGTRRCLGAAFAQMEMRVVLRTLLREASLEPASERPERIVRRNVTLAPGHGTPAILRELAGSTT